MAEGIAALEVYLLRAQRRLARRPPSSEVMVGWLQPAWRYDRDYSNLPECLETRELSAGCRSLSKSLGNVIEAG